MFLFFSIGCTKEIKEEQFGNLHGTIVSLDSQSYTFAALNKATVKLQAGNYNVETTTDSTGLFEFNDIPIGTYNLFYSKEGYSTFIDYGVQVFGGLIPVQLNTISLYELLNEKIVIGDIKTNGVKGNYSSNLNIEIEYEKIEETNTMCLLLLSKNDNIDLQHYEYSFFKNIYFISDYFHLISDYEKFPENSKWYIKLYTVASKAYYFDPETGKKVYYTANTDMSSKGSFTISEAEEY